MFNSFNQIVTKVILIIIVLTNSLVGQTQSPEFILVQGGSFTMGDTFNTAEINKDLPSHLLGLPIHKVKLNPFKISKTEITVAQYRNYCKTTGKEMPKEPKWGWQENAPIVNVSWQDAMSYCAWLSNKLNQTITLPTEAQWEYAARGGNKSKDYKYSGSNDITKVAWFNDNSNKTSHVVAGKQVNELGLYDMTGNVWEWCLDWYDKDYYKNSPESNPENTVKNERQRKVVRGGAWSDYDSFSFINFRNSCKPLDTLDLVGFRVVWL